METLPPPERTEFFLNRLLDYILRTHISYDKAFHEISRRYRVPKWLYNTYYKLGYYVVLYYYGLQWLAAQHGYGVKKGAAIAFFRDIGYSVRKLVRILDRETRDLGIVHRLSIRYSYPEYIVRDLLEYMDPNELEKYLKALNEKRYWIRVNTLKTTIDRVIKCLKKNNIGFDIHHILPYMIRIRKPKWFKPSSIECIVKGEAIPQDLASAYVVEALHKLPGKNILDACSAPGLKISHLYMLDNNIRCIACDISWNRSIILKDILRQHNIPIHTINVLNCDSTEISFNLIFERALVDAPCSGSGSVPGDPAVKIAIRRKGKLDYYYNLQKRILENVLQYSRYVVYSVCSIHPLEGEEVIQYIVDHGLASPIDIKLPLRKAYSGYGVSGETFRTYPHIDGCQGFYIAVLEASRK